MNPYLLFGLLLAGIAVAAFLARFLLSRAGRLPSRTSHAPVVLIFSGAILLFGAAIVDYTMDKGVVAPFYCTFAVLALIASGLLARQIKGNRDGAPPK